MSQPPPTYLEDSDEFNPAYLEWLGTLSSDVGTCPYRVTRENGRIIRYEFWIGTTHHVFPVPS